MEQLIYMRIRTYINEKGLILKAVARNSGIKEKRFYLLMSGDVNMYADEFEAICNDGLEIDPTVFLRKNS